MLSVDLHGLGDVIIEDAGSLFQELLRLFHLRLRTLEADAHSPTRQRIGRLTLDVRDINLCSRGNTNLVHLSTAMADQHRDLILRDRDDGRVRMIFGPLQQAE